MPKNQNNHDQVVVTRSDYYAHCRILAQTKRQEHSIITEKLNLNVIQRIYRSEGITLDRKKLKGNRIKAAYYCDDGDCSVLINSGLPREPRLFSLAHELKHHYLDREKIQNGEI